MERIVITGALGQIGTELVLKCREIYGNDNVLATDIREPEEDSPVNNGPFEVLDVTNREAMMAITGECDMSILTAQLPSRSFTA